MPERGADPNVPRLQRKVLDAVRSLTSPLLPDDYLELINPLWSTRELRGRIESIDIEGVRHWRAYSLTSDPEREDGCISITVKNVDEGKVSPYLVRRGRPGTIVGLGGVEGDFVLSERLPEKLLFISAGSGITPIMSMLRSLAHRNELDDVLLVHSVHNEEDVIFGEQLRELEREHQGFRVHRQLTRERGRMKPEHLDQLCEDWREREAYLSGPAEMLDAMAEHWDRQADGGRLHVERFQPKIGGDIEEGKGGTIAFLESDCRTECDGGTPILVAGEEEGSRSPTAAGKVSATRASASSCPARSATCVAGT